MPIPSSINPPFELLLQKSVGIVLKREVIIGTMILGCIACQPSGAIQAEDN
jgi:hypothetical protein